MRKFYSLAIMLMGLLAVAGLVSSCDLKFHEDSPEYPLNATYTISAGIISFSGPEQLQLDIQSWINANQKVYDEPVNYSTGEKSEFTKADTEAAKKFEEFFTKFKAYLDTTVSAELAKGTYGKDGSNVRATFYVFASRAQGKEGTVKYEQYEPKFDS